MNDSVILGISFGHGDSSAALVVHGKLVAAAEEERFTRVKHFALFPSRAIEYCLRHAGLKASDVGTVAIARRPRNAFFKKLSLGLRYPALWGSGRGGRSADAPSLSKLFESAGLAKARPFRVEHHLAHMFSCKFLCPSDDAALLSLDGLGDFVSAAIGRSHGNDIEIVDRVHFPHSLGYFYTALTQFLGFPYYGDEFKVMGLSSYGNPVFLPAMRELVREDSKFGFQLNLEAFPILKRPMRFRIENSQPYIDPFYNGNFLTQIFGIPARKPGDVLTRKHWDLAKSVQARFEEVANHLVGQLHDRVGGENLALAGGCAHNSVWIGKIPRQTAYKNVYVAPASHDAGIAAGAAIAATRIRVVPEGGHWALLGPCETDFAGISEEWVTEDFTRQTFSETAELIDWMVERLADGHIFGLYHGRLEFGPRALGSRSIIADPRVPTMRDRLNSRVKHRESFRPFAASVLNEYQQAWFDGVFFAPTMEAVFPVKAEMRDRIPAVVHADQTCRIQSITRETQPFYWALIERFRQKTGVPMLVNTSFNDSEPIVCSPEDAVRCYLNTDMDHLVIGQNAYSRVRSAVAKAV